ncbi:hypothetical protein BSPWISOX_2949 [uncultured Gammaproteobacteria bacterium]|jgi:hypothetical protein|nr:hypothetical protein BSPWISOX_2949 [uncultured Gammaproteobacteria bacterium]
MRILPYIVICFLSASAANANELNQYLEQYNNHQNLVKNLNQEIQLFKLRSDAQQLKTKLQKDKLECQQFGGCQTKTLYTPLKNKASNKANKQQRDRELQAVLNKPLPKITSITNNIVSFDHSPQQFKVGDLVYGVWLIKLITATTVELNNKDNNSTSTLYFYWR